MTATTGSTGAAGGPSDGWGSTVTGFENLVGSLGGDFVYGDERPNSLSGEAGDDHLDGRGGRDKLDGGRGADTCANGEQLDRCEV